MSINQQRFLLSKRAHKLIQILEFQPPQTSSKISNTNNSTPPKNSEISFSENARFFVEQYHPHTKKTTNLILPFCVGTLAPISITLIFVYPYTLDLPLPRKAVVGVTSTFAGLFVLWAIGKLVVWDNKKRNSRADLERGIDSPTGGEDGRGPLLGSAMQLNEVARAPQAREKNPAGRVNVGLNTAFVGRRENTSAGLPGASSPNAGNFRPRPPGDQQQSRAPDHGPPKPPRRPHTDRIFLERPRRDPSPRFLLCQV